MTKPIWAGLAGVAVILAGTSAQAQIYATGENPPLDGWSPGGNSAYQLLDDGTNGDAVSGDGILSRDITLNGSTTSGWFIWKAATNGWATESPNSGLNASSNSNAANASVMKFVLDTNAPTDGFTPDKSGNFSAGLPYTVPGPIGDSGFLRATGTFADGFPGDGAYDWDLSVTTTTLVDDGTNGDAVSGDGIHTLTVTGLATGSYAFKLTVNGAWDGAIGTLGTYGLGDNIPFTVLDPSDTITIECKPHQGGRFRVTNDNPTINPGPPFFAVSPAWDTNMSSETTQLYDDGTNGDVTSGDGIYSRTFEATAAGEYGVQVKQYVGPQYPDSGAGYPMNISFVGQSVLVQFDTNVYSDGYVPNTRFVWTNPATRFQPTYMQIVGSFQDDFGGAAHWNENDPLFEIFDGGANGDLVAGDKVYAGTFTSPSALTGQEWKAVAQGGYKYQFGGEGEGLTLTGNNNGVPVDLVAGSVTFHVDAVTGRIATGSTAPTRPATLDANPAPSAPAEDWQLFE